MKYMVAELLFTVKKAWYESGMICLLMSDNKESTILHPIPRFL